MGSLSVHLNPDTGTITLRHEDIDTERGVTVQAVTVTNAAALELGHILTSAAEQWRWANG